MSSPLPYCRTNQTSSDVGMIGMITASARYRWTYQRRNGTKRKFFNDFSRACMSARARGSPFRVCPHPSDKRNGVEGDLVSEVSRPGDYGFAPGLACSKN
jgi:hypothetical protein